METSQNLGKIGADWQAEAKRVAGEIAERMMTEQSQVTEGGFVELEDLAVEVSQRVGEEVLRAFLARQAEEQAVPTCCQRCGEPCEEKPPRRREVQTRVGQVAWYEPVEYCRKCRQSFSPSVRNTED